MTSYIKPSISKYSIARCNPDGTKNVVGTSAVATLNWEPSVYGEQTIDATITMKYVYGGQTFTLDLIGTTQAPVLKSAVTTPTQRGKTGFETMHQYAFSVSIDDGISVVNSNVYLGTAQFMLHFNATGDGIGFGKAS